MTTETEQVQDKLLPQSRDAELGALGSILIDRECVDEVADIVTSDDFYAEQNRTVFAAVEDMHADGREIDLITLTDELDRRGVLEGIGGVSFVSSLANNVPTSANARHYAQIVEYKATQRRLIGVAAKIAGLAYTPGEDTTTADALMQQAEQALFSLSEQRRRRDVSASLDAAHVMRDLIERLDALHEGRTEFLGVPTGLRDLDKMTGGLRRSDLVILAARPAMGKTGLALSIADHAAVEAGVAVVVFSLEMGTEQLGDRLVSLRAGVDLQHVRSGHLGEAEWERVSQAAGEIAAAPLTIDATAGISLATLRSRARRLVMSGQCDLIIVDYLQLMQSDRGDRHENRQQEVSAIARGLKQLARELDVPVLALSQLSRAVEARKDKRPQMADLRESGEIENAADIILGLYRDEVYNAETDTPNIAELGILKHRNGPIGTVKLYFEGEHARFRNLVFEPSAV